MSDVTPVVIFANKASVDYRLPSTHKNDSETRYRNDMDSGEF